MNVCVDRHLLQKYTCGIKQYKTVRTVQSKWITCCALKKKTQERAFLVLLAERVSSSASPKQKRTTCMHMEDTE